MGELESNSKLNDFLPNLQIFMRSEQFEFKNESKCGIDDGH